MSCCSNKKEFSEQSERRQASLCVDDEACQPPAFEASLRALAYRAVRREGRRK